VMAVLAPWMYARKRSERLANERTK
jgi:hypothetical protein